jgi:hypothetical protein
MIQGPKDFLLMQCSRNAGSNTPGREPTFCYGVLHRSSRPTLTHVQAGTLVLILAPVGGNTICGTLE